MSYSLLTKFHCRFKIIIAFIQKTQNDIREDMLQGQPRVLYLRLQDQCKVAQRLCHWNTRVVLPHHLTFGVSIASILFWKLEYCSPWRARQFYGQSSSFVPGVVKWIKYTFSPAGFYFYHCLETQGLWKLVSILNLAWPLKSLDFSAFEPFELIGKLGSPAIIGPKDGFCWGQLTPSERC